MISSSQRPLPDNTQLSQQTDIHAPSGPTVSGGECPQTYALDRAATGTGYCSDLSSLKNGKVGGLLFDSNEGFEPYVFTCRQLNIMR